MQPAAQMELVGDEETVYRRIPVSQGWYDPATKLLSPLAFRPRDDDETGLSLVRAEPHNTPEQAGKGLAKKGYYVAALRVGEIRAHGMGVVSRPVDGVNGHVEIPEIRLETRDTDQELTFRVHLSRICHEVHGPFVSAS